MGITVVEQGLFTTIQDLGRYGYQSLGFSVNGAMDTLAMRLANSLVNNDENEAVLEMSFVGPSIKFETNMVIALVGADMSPQLNNQPVSNNQLLPVENGDVLQMRTAKTGLHCYLAVKGGFDLPETLGSKSTSIKANIGGFLGRKLEAGDFLPIKTEYSLQKKINWRLSSSTMNYLNSEPIVIHFLEGRQYTWFTNEAQTLFETEIFHTTTQSDRMGLRLHGPELQTSGQKELITEATTFGTIQVPPNGHPIILMADRQPTGGYPKIGQVIQADLPKLSQLRPGKGFIFKRCNLEEAKQRLLTLEQQLHIIKSGIRLKEKD